MSAPAPSPSLRAPGRRRRGRSARRAGEVLAILGANGSGKTSLLRALAGVQPCSGSVVHGAGAIGFMPQDNAARAGLSAFEIVLLGRLRSLTLRVGEADLAGCGNSASQTGCETIQ